MLATSILCVITWHAINQSIPPIMTYMQSIKENIACKVAPIISLLIIQWHHMYTMHPTMTYSQSIDNDPTIILIHWNLASHIQYYSMTFGHKKGSCLAFLLTIFTLLNLAIQILVMSGIKHCILPLMIFSIKSSIPWLSWFSTYQIAFWFSSLPA